MPTEAEWDNWIWKTREGQVFTRPRRFKPSESEYRHEDGGDKWWFASDDERPGVGVSHGYESVEILEIVMTETAGPLAIYRRWITDPDGNELTALWSRQNKKKKLFRMEKALRGSLNAQRFTLGFGRCAVNAATIKQKKAAPKLYVVH
jgi:hypothetical protein